jgi:phosphoribosylamine--glycine ligase
VLASGGYPIEYETGKPISGIEKAESVDHVHVIQAGTSRATDGTIITGGGRVLNVVGRGATLQQALDRAYEAVDLINFDGKTYRTDIGSEGLRTEG